MFYDLMREHDELTRKMIEEMREHYEVTCIQDVIYCTPKKAAFVRPQLQEDMSND